MKNYSKNTKPIYFDVIRGKGEIIYDGNQKRYLDFTSQTLNLSLGQCHPKITKSISDVINSITYISSRFGNPYSHKLIKQLMQMAPSELTKVNIKITSGTLANEGALKMAYKKRNCIGAVSFLGSHHGQSMETMRISGKNFDKKYLNRNNVDFLKPCNCDVYSNGKHTVTCVRQSINEFSSLIESKHKTIATVILEPIMVEAGVIIHDKEFLSTIRKITKDYDIPLIFDEVQTGFGWLGEYFATNYFGVTPDILTGGKAFATGYPLSMTFSTRDMDNLDYGEHEITDGANPISCVVASTNLDILSKTNLLKQVKKNEKKIRHFLKCLKNEHSMILDFRGIGHLWGIVILENQKNTRTEQIRKQCFDGGLLLRIASGQTNVLIFKPPLITSQKSFLEAFDILDMVLKRVT